VAAHAGVYLGVLALLGTGVWLLASREGDPSPLSWLAGMPDTRLHVWVGWLFGGLVLAGLVLKVRAAWRFTAESLRFRRGDLAWFRAWPNAVFTDRFPRHDGHFDPGQRVANVALVVALATATASGAAMALLRGGPAFVWLVPVHRWSTYVLVPLIVGHILIASGCCPATAGCGDRCTSAAASMCRSHAGSGQVGSNVTRPDSTGLIKENLWDRRDIPTERSRGGGQGTLTVPARSVRLTGLGR
jgi:formate dehydrogenase subunit gamma